MQLDTLNAKQEEAAKTERINQRDFEEENAVGMAWNKELCRKEQKGY